MWWKMHIVVKYWNNQLLLKFTYWSHHILTIFSMLATNNAANIGWKSYMIPDRSIRLHFFIAAQIAHPMLAWQQQRNAAFIMKSIAFKYHS